MKKKLSSIVVICLLLTVVFYLISCPNQVLESVSFSISIWKDNLFPSLFPFFVVSNLLLSFGFVQILGKLLSKFMRVFRLPSTSSFPLMISLFSGFPSGAKYTSKLVKEGYLTKDEGNTLICFTHYSNPLFIMGFIGGLLLNNKAIALAILISHIVSGLLVGYIFSRKLKYKENKILNKSISRERKTFGEELQKSITDSLSTMFLLLGIVTIFSIITSMITNFFSLSDFSKTVLSGILEMTQGIKNTNNLSLSIISKVLMITFFISFGGISVHMQVLSLISEAKIKYKYFFLARLLHGILATVLVFTLYNIFIL